MIDDIIEKMMSLRSSSERRAARYLMREVDHLLIDGRFDDIDTFLSVGIDYTLRERLAILTITLMAHNRLPSRVDFFAHSYKLTEALRPNDVASLFQGLERPSVRL